VPRSRLPRTFHPLTPLAAVAAAALVAGGVAGSASKERHRFAPANYFVSPQGSDAGRCRKAHPCASFQRAFRLARPGQIVEVAGGSYPPQRVAGDKGSSRDVVVRAAAGAHVSVGDPGGDCPRGLDVWASHVTFNGLDRVGDVCLVGEAEGGAPQSDVTLRTVRATSIVIDSIRHVRILGGAYGGRPGAPTHHNSRVQKAAASMPSDIVIDGASFGHYACSPDDAGCHIECLIVGAARNLTIRNSHFSSCPIMDIFLETFNGPISGVTIDGNVLDDATEPLGGPGSGRPAVLFKGNSRFTRVRVRNNSVGGPIDVQQPGDPADFHVARNVGAANGEGCHPRVSYVDNMWTKGQRCGPTDRGAPFGYELVDGRLRVVRGAAALVEQAFSLASDGTPVGTIARRLGRGWTTDRVRRLLSDPAYRGGHYGARGCDPRIVDPSRWRKVQARY
jgi:hypothetical protein